MFSLEQRTMYSFILSPSLDIKSDSLLLNLLYKQLLSIKSFCKSLFVLLEFLIRALLIQQQPKKFEKKKTNLKYILNLKNLKQKFSFHKRKVLLVKFNVV